MASARTDAFVFFGETGDLAYKKIFPSLQAMVKRGHLDVPVIGVAKAGWALEQPVYPYEQKTWGPKESEQLLASLGGWHNPTPPVQEEFSFEAKA